MPRPVTANTSAEERSRYAREIMSRLARRAYRRPVTPDEVERLARYIDMAQKDGDSFERGVQIAIQAMLVSPHFLFASNATRCRSRYKATLRPVWPRVN
jgi:hypothetical protein